MWMILEFIVLAFIVLLSITELFYPLAMGKPLFPSFRNKEEVVNVKESVDAPLEEKLSQAKKKVREVKEIQDEVNKHFKSAEQLKDEADSLLNNSNN